jgi:hypothetical protein
MKRNVLGGMAFGLLAWLSTGCDDKNAERCRTAQQEASRAWQAYETTARDAVNRADDDANAAGRAASAAGARAESVADESSRRLMLADLVPDLPPPGGADAGTPATPPPAVHPGAMGAAGVPPAAGSDPRRAPLVAARDVALTLVETVRSLGAAAREIGGAISARNSEAAHDAMGRVDEAARRTQAGAARIAVSVALMQGNDPVGQALTRVNETARQLAQAANDAARASQGAIVAMQAADGALERANAALNASGAAFRNAVMARNAAHAVPDDPNQPQIARARAASDQAWNVCSTVH